MKFSLRETLHRMLPTALRPPERSFALDELDLKLRPWLDFRRGFFVEAGANDGLSFSNTLFYECFRGWRGLLIEPIPKLAARCRKNRPRCVVENCALVAPEDAGKEITMNYCNLMSLVKGAMNSDEADRAHLDKGREVQGIAQSYEVKVPGRTLTEVLDQHRIERVDFFSLDVEGYELPALRGLDLERIRPRFFLIEVRDRPAIDAYLGERYEAVAELSHHDILYRARA